VARPSRSAPLIARTALRRHSPALREAFLSRHGRLAEDDARLAAHARPGAPHILSIRPATGSPRVSRLATNGDVLLAALEAGREAVHAVFAPS
jgi:hypothetical protein